MYLLDSYSLHAASALAANAVMRSLFGAVFPLFSTYLYGNLGLNWAGTCKFSFYLSFILPSKHDSVNPSINQSYQ